LAQLVRAVEPLQAERTALLLIKEFGSLGQVLGATASRITRVTGSEAIGAMLSASMSAVLEGLREEVSRSQVDLRDPRLICYLKAQLQGEEEHLHAIFLDSRRRYIRDERVASGGWANLSVRLRPLVRLTMETGAAKLVLIHNHPSGNPRPSEADIVFTQMVVRITQPMGIELLDHLIIAGASVFSMRTAGLIS